jgi:proteic killer suppression protein
MLQSFKNEGTEDVFNGENTKAARKICPSAIWKVAARKLDQVDSVTVLHELRIPPNNKLEALSGDRNGQHSIRINDQYRICFVWTESDPDQVEIIDYHLWHKQEINYGSRSYKPPTRSSRRNAVGRVS